MTSRINSSLVQLGLKLGTVLAVLAFTVQATATQAATPASLVIESWRAGDEAVWDTIIADFNKTNPDIKVKFQATKPDQYESAPRAKLESDTSAVILPSPPS